MAKGIIGKLSEMDPEDAAYLQQQEQDFERGLAEAVTNADTPRDFRNFRS